MHAKLQSANLQDAMLRKAQLQGADLGKAAVEMALLRQGVVGKKNKFFLGFTVRAARLEVGIF